MRWALLVWCALLLGLTAVVAFARDTDGLSQRLTPEQREWARTLRNREGVLCCDEAEGLDPTWRPAISSPSGYQVLLDGAWTDVSVEALITKPNKLGVARVWVMFKNGAKVPRCFVPGAGG